MENKLSKFLPKKNQWLIVLLIGILLVVIALPTKTGSDLNKGIDYGIEEVNSTDIEKRLETLLGNMQNVGKVQVMITFREDETVEGIVVLAQGAGNAVVVRNITEVVQALFDVDAHKIKVIESNSNN